MQRLPSIIPQQKHIRTGQQSSIEPRIITKLELQLSWQGWGEQKANGNGEVVPELRLL